MKITLHWYWLAIPRIATVKQSKFKSIFKSNLDRCVWFFVFLYLYGWFWECNSWSHYSHFILKAEEAWLTCILKYMICETKCPKDNIKCNIYSIYFFKLKLINHLFAHFSSKHNICLAWKCADMMRKYWTFFWYWHFTIGGIIQKWSGKFGMQVSFIILCNLCDFEANLCTTPSLL